MVYPSVWLSNDGYPTCKIFLCRDEIGAKTSFRCHLEIVGFSNIYFLNLAENTRDYLKRRYPVLEPFLHFYQFLVINEDKIIRTNLPGS